MSTDSWLRVFCSMMANAVLFGIGTITVLSIPALADQAKYLIPAVVVASFVLAPLVAGAIFPRMRIRRWGKAAWVRGDLISG